MVLVARERWESMMSFYDAHQTSACHLSPFISTLVQPKSKGNSSFSYLGNLLVELHDHIQDILLHSNKHFGYLPHRRPGPPSTQHHPKLVTQENPWPSIFIDRQWTIAIFIKNKSIVTTFFIKSVIHFYHCGWKSVSWWQKSHFMVMILTSLLANFSLTRLLGGVLGLWWVIFDL